MYCTLSNSEIATIDNILQDYDLSFKLHLSEFVRSITDEVGLYDVSRYNLIFLKNVLILRVLNRFDVCKVYNYIDGVLHPNDILYQKTLESYAKIVRY